MQTTWASTAGPGLYSRLTFTFRRPQSLGAGSPQRSRDHPARGERAAPFAVPHNVILPAHQHDARARSNSNCLSHAHTGARTATGRAAYCHRSKNTPTSAATIRTERGAALPPRTRYVAAQGTRTKRQRHSALRIAPGRPRAAPRPSLGYASSRRTRPRRASGNLLPLTQGQQTAASGSGRGSLSRT